MMIASPIVGWFALQSVLLSTHRPSTSITATQRVQKGNYDYDVVVIGGGASGLMSAGTASSFGKRTLLLDEASSSSLVARQEEHLGGDCTNAACVPSKAMRAAAMTSDGPESVQRHVSTTVASVRSREDVDRIVSSGLEVKFVDECEFISPHELKLTESGNATVVVSSRAFIVATGAGPIVPARLATEAQEAGMPMFTYRTVLNPDLNGPFYDVLQNTTSQAAPWVIAGGGSTACELAQTLARMGTKVTIVAPTLLPDEDVAVRYAAVRRLERDLHVTLRLGKRVVGVVNDTTVLVVADEQEHGRSSSSSSTTTPLSCSALLLAVGRSPAVSLRLLRLDRAGVSWDERTGVHVDRLLRSVDRPHVWAAGDCAVGSRRASHAGWTGFMVVRNAFLRPVSRSLDAATHPYVPRVTTFGDIDTAAIGLSHVDCVRRYGNQGFRYGRVYHDTTDRGDVDRVSSSNLEVGFTELRVHARSDRVLGATVVSPAAAETVNEVGLALVKSLTCRDIARTLHVYPSYGYPLQRIALALTLNSPWGLLCTCGRWGRLLGAGGRTVERLLRAVLTTLLRQRPSRKLRLWQAEGADQMILLCRNPTDDTNSNNNIMSSWNGTSFLDVSEDEKFCAMAREQLQSGNKNYQSKSSNADQTKEPIQDHDDNDDLRRTYRAFVAWLHNKP